MLVRRDTCASVASSLPGGASTSEHKPQAMQRINKAGHTPIDNAVCARNCAMVRVLQPSPTDRDLAAADAGADAGVTPLMRAARKHDLQQVRQLLEEGSGAEAVVERINQTSKEAGSALSYAAEAGAYEIISHLIFKKADVNVAAPADGSTPLMSACMNGHHLAVSDLLRAGAKLQQAGSDGRTPLMVACLFGHFAVVALLLQDGSFKDASSDLVNSVDAKGFTALRLASEHNQVQVIPLLIEAKADVDKADLCQHTPLMAASKMGFDQAMQMLMRQDAAISLEDQQGHTALMLVCRYGHQNALPTLLAYESKPEHKNQMERTALHYACEVNNATLLKTLLGGLLDNTDTPIGQRFERISPKDREGLTPLMIAARNEFIDLAELLLDAARSLDIEQGGTQKVRKAGLKPHAGVYDLSGSGCPSPAVCGKSYADLLVMATDNGKRSALHHAVDGGSLSVVHTLLQETWEQRFSVDAGGFTPLMRAINKSADEEAQKVSPRHRVGPKLEEALLSAVNGSFGSGQQQGGAQERGGIHRFLGSKGALMIDSGTGDMKIIACICTADGTVLLDELKELNVKKHGKKVDTIETVSEFSERGEASPLFKGYEEQLLQAIGDLADHSTAKGKLYESVRFQETILGATAWYRKLDDASTPKRQDAMAFLDALIRSINERLSTLGFGASATAKWSRISDLEEAKCEYQAIMYAARRMGLTLPHCCISGGSGSVQVTGYDARMSFKLPLKEYELALKDAADKTAKMEELKEKIRAVVSKEITKTQIVQLLREQLKQKKTIHLIVIGTFFYGAMSVGLAKKGDMNYKYKNGAEVFEVLDEFLRRGMAGEVFQHRASHQCDTPKDKDLGNLIRLWVLLDTLVGANKDDMSLVQLLIARDWELDGDSYRTTWTAGYWLDICNREEQAALRGDVQGHADWVHS